VRPPQRGRRPGGAAAGWLLGDAASDDAALQAAAQAIGPLLLRQLGRPHHA
jgi:hypothetical protein